MDRIRERPQIYKKTNGDESWEQPTKEWWRWHFAGMIAASFLTDSEVAMALAKASKKCNLSPEDLLARAVIEQAEALIEALESSTAVTHASSESSEIPTCGRL